MLGGVELIRREEEEEALNDRIHGPGEECFNSTRKTVSPSPRQLERDEESYTKVYSELLLHRKAELSPWSWCDGIVFLFFRIAMGSCAQPGDHPQTKTPIPLFQFIPFPQRPQIHSAVHSLLRPFLAFPASITK